MGSSYSISVNGQPYTPDLKLKSIDGVLDVVINTTVNNDPFASLKTEPPQSYYDNLAKQQSQGHHSCDDECDGHESDESSEDDSPYSQESYQSSDEESEESRKQFEADHAKLENRYEQRANGIVEPQPIAQPAEQPAAVLEADEVNPVQQIQNNEEAQRNMLLNYNGDHDDYYATKEALLASVVEREYMMGLSEDEALRLALLESSLETTDATTQVIETIQSEATQPDATVESEEEMPVLQQVQTVQPQKSSFVAWSC